MGRELLEKLRGFPGDKYGVVYAVLFGSAASRESFEDVDVAVLFEREPELGVLAELVEGLARHLGLPYGGVDIVPLNWDLPCVLVVEALGRGVLVYARSIDEYLDDALIRLKVCWDFEISYRKLGLLDAALEAVKRKWQS